jgi:hypothetical protein
LIARYRVWDVEPDRGHLIVEIVSKHIAIAKIALRPFAKRMSFSSRVIAA